MERIQAHFLNLIAAFTIALPFVASFIIPTIYPKFPGLLYNFGNRDCVVQLSREGGRPAGGKLVVRNLASLLSQNGRVCSGSKEPITASLFCPEASTGTSMIQKEVEIPCSN